MLINQTPTENVGSEEELLRVERQYWHDMLASLEALEKNEDFKRVILDGYFKDKAINGVSLLAVDQIKQSGARGDVMEQLVSISQLQDHFSTIRNLGFVPDDEDEYELEGD